LAALVQELGAEDGKPVIVYSVMGPNQDPLPETTCSKRKTKIIRVKNLAPAPAAPVPKPGPLYRVKDNNFDYDW